MELVAGMTALGGIDAFWFMDDERNYANIVSYLRFKRFKAKEVKEQLLKNGLRFSRIRSTVVKFMGIWWYKEHSEEYIRANIDKFMIVKTGVHSEKDIADFMAKEQSIRDDFELV
jgi:hypothetical protein